MPRAKTLAVAAFAATLAAAAVAAATLAANVAAVAILGAALATLGESPWQLSDKIGWRGKG